MKTTLKMKALNNNALSLLLVMSFAISCSNKNTSNDATTQTVAAQAKSVESIVVNGTVKAIAFGKDGYTADVQTDTEGVYVALVSIVNMGGPDNYKSCEVGDEVSFKGVPAHSEEGKRLQVKEIISIISTISGTVKAIASGKDGYTAEVKTDTAGIYAALVSIANVGGRENYKQYKVGDKVSFKGTTSVLGGVKQMQVKEIISIGATPTLMSISPISFRGIQIGDLIAEHKDYIKKTKLKTGEGSFDVYEIKDFDNNPAGYFLPDPNDKLLVGDITVKSPKAQTLKGIKIGSTFQDLLKVFPDIAVNGSEIEGQTHATANNLSYRLDIPNFTNKIDRAKIPATAKITEITINRGEAAKALILEGKYNKIKAAAYCWQTNKVLNLHTQPSTTSKVEGKHFAGEVLKVLGTKTVNNQLWVNVAYTFKIKAGYEHTFADGQVTPGGEPTGWIGGAETPRISCK